MKQILLSFPLLLALLATSCVKETGGEAAGQLEFVSVPVDICPAEDGPDTKSLISLEAESFQKAALFAFNASGRVLLDGGVPVTKVTATKNFSWSLPVGVDVDIYVIANYGDLDLSGYLSNKTLRESDLEALTFSCPSSEAFAALGTGGCGLPMSGVRKGVRITGTEGSVPVQMKKLFARYDFFFDVSAFTEKGYSVEAVYIASAKANTEVPYFGEGFAQTASTKLRTIDYGTASDLTELDYGSRSHAATLYFLENCQGAKSGASNWWEVASSGMPGLERCSYIDLGIKATDPDGNDMTFFYWIYLGDDCTTNFDVRRNAYRTVKLTMKTPDEVPPTQGLAIIASKSVLSNTIPGACSLYFETNLPQDAISVASGKSEVAASLLSYSSTSEHQVTAYPHSGWVTAATTPDYNSGTNADITARITVGRYSSGTWIVGDQKEVAFAAYVPTVTHSLSVTAPSGTEGTVGDALSLKAWYDTFSDGVRTGRSDVTADSGTTWTCTSPNKASISFPSKGSVLASSAGTYTIRADYGGESDSIELAFTEADYITVNDWDKSWDWDSYGSTSAQLATVSTNLSRSALSVSCSESDVHYSLASTANPDGSYNLTLYWKSANSSTSERSAKVYVEGAGQSDYARVRQTGKPADVITYRLGVYPTSMSVTEGKSSSAPTLYKEKYVNGIYDSRTVYSGSSSWSVTAGSNYVSVNSSTGVVTAKFNGAGSATVRATVTDSSFESGYRTADISVTVNEKEDVITYRLAVSPSSFTLTEGESSSTPTLYKEKYVNGSYSSRTVYSGSASWSVTSGSNYASVNGSGVVTAKSNGAGSANVRATVTDSSFESGYKSADISVTVNAHVPVETYRYYAVISPSSASIGVGETQSFSAVLKKQKQLDGVDSGSPSNVSGVSFSYYSSNTSVATMSGPTATGKSFGSSTITASCSYSGSSYSDTAELSVSYKSGFAWLDSKITIDAGGSATASFVCSTSSPSFSANDDEITIGTPTVHHTASNGYEYSGSVTIYASNDMYNGDEGIITGSAGGGSDNLDFVIQKENYTISISASKTTLLPDGETVTLTITSPSSSSWTLSDDEGYFSFSKTSGTGNASVSATIGTNEYSSARSTDIYVRLDNGKASDFVRLTQNASSITVIQIDVWIRSTYRYGKYYTYAETSENVPCEITVTDSRGQTYVIEEYDSESSDEYQWRTEWGDVSTCIAASVSPSSYTTPDGKTKYTFVPDV